MAQTHTIECMECERTIKVPEGFDLNIVTFMAMLNLIWQKGWDILMEFPSYEHNYNVRFFCSKCKTRKHTWKNQ
jgi:hypothetical protein